MAESYVLDSLSNMATDGMTDDLWEMVRQDSKRLKKLNVCDDKQRNLYFYVDNFCNDLCDEFGYSVAKDKREDVVDRAFACLKDREKLDLTDIRKGVFKAILEVSPTHKLAFPNTTGVVGLNAKIERDVDKWVTTLSEIYAASHAGENREDAEKRIMEGWNPMEKLDFSAWTRYYERSDHEKYAMHKVALMPSMLPEDLETMPDQLKAPGRPRKRTRNHAESQRALISRLDSADKLLREFSSVWPAGTWNRLHQVLSDLKREILQLKTVSSMTDRIIRSASIWATQGFQEGSNLLMKIAAPGDEEDDVASQIEKALTGKEYDVKPKGGAGVPPAGDELPGIEEEFSPEEMEAMPPAGAGEELPPTEAPPSEEAPVEEALPEEAAPEPEKEMPKMEMGKKTSPEDNPYMGTTVADVVEALEPIVTGLQERKMARELAKVDMMLDAQNIASHFPELGEAMNKSLESNTYVMTRLEKMLGKLKGGVNSKREDEEEGTEINMDELTGEAPEAPSFEVEEEVPAAAPAPAAPPATASKKDEIVVLSVRK